MSFRAEGHGLALGTLSLTGGLYFMAVALADLAVKRSSSLASRLPDSTSRARPGLVSISCASTSLPQSPDLGLLGNEDVTGSTPKTHKNRKLNHQFMKVDLFSFSYKNQKGPKIKFYDYRANY